VIGSILFCPFVSPASASPIIISTLLPEPISGWSGGTIGSIYVGTANPNAEPDGFYRLKEAQSFTVYADYANVTAAADLAWLGFNTPGMQSVTVSFSLALDSAGTPGASVASTDVTIPPLTELQVFDINFQNLSLMDGVTYWLVATTASIEYVGPLCCSGEVAAWPQSGQINHAFAIYGTETGNPIVDNGPVPDSYGGPGGAFMENSNPWVYYRSINAFPEPSTLLLVGTGLVASARRWRNRRQRS
jgi:hypothetical protein